MKVKKMALANYKKPFYKKLVLEMPKFCVLSRAFLKEHKRMGVKRQNFNFGEGTDKHEAKNLQQTYF